MEGTDHPKTALAALILAVGGAFTLGLTVPPALICALVARREAKEEGKKPHRFVAAAIVTSILVSLPAGCLWWGLIYGSLKA